MNTFNEMRICVYSDTDQTVLKRSLNPCDHKNFNIQGFKTDKVNIYNGESFIKKCGIAERIIPFEIKPKLFWYIDHINVIGNHYYHIAIKKCNHTSNKQRRICDKRRSNMIKRSLRWHGKILDDRPYDTADIKYIEFSYEMPSSTIRHMRNTYVLSIMGIILGIIGIVVGITKC